MRQTKGRRWSLWVATTGASAALAATACGTSSTNRPVALVGKTAITQGQLNQARAANQVVQGVRLDMTSEATKSQVQALVQQQAVITWALNHHVTTRAAAQSQAQSVIAHTIVPSVGGSAALNKRLSQNGISRSQFQQYVANQVVVQDAFNQVTAKVTAPTTADARRYYDQNPSFYVSPPEALIRTITVKTASQAAGIESQIKRGAAFSALATRDSLDAFKAQGGSHGWVQLGASPSVPRSWLSTVNALKPGQMGIAKGPMGYSIIEVQASRAGATIPFTAVEPAIQAELVQNAKEKVFDNWAAALMKGQKVRLFHVG